MFTLSTGSARQTRRGVSCGKFGQQVVGEAHWRRCALPTAGRWVCGLALAAAHPAPAAHVEWREGIANPAALRAWVAAARHDRADVVMLGDSNQLHSGYGWEGAYVNALNVRTGIYATGIHWCGENNGVGRGMGEGYATTNSGGTSSGFAFTGAPPALDQFARLYDPAVGSEYLYVPEGVSLPGSRQVGMYLFGTLNRAATLRFWLVDGVFDSGEGVYSPYVRMGQSPYSALAQFPSVGTATESAPTLRTQSFTLSADPSRATSLEFRYTPTWFNPGFVGPLFLLWQRVEQVEAVGTSVHTLYAVGGRSARFMANTLVNASDAMLGAYFTEVRRLQPDGDRHTLFRIHQGLNDRNETLPSVGVGLLPGNSPQAYADNISATIDRIRTVWTAQGFAEHELAFLVVTPFNVAEPQDAQLASYRDAAAQLTLVYPRLAVVDQSALLSYQHMVDHGYFFNAFDRNHLSVAGFNAVVGAELDLVLTQRCTADFDDNGGIDGGDLAAFFTAFEDGAPAADIDHNGGVDGGDLSAFLVAFEDGCA